MSNLVFCSQCIYCKEVCPAMCAPIKYCKYSTAKVYRKDYFKEEWVDEYCENMNKNNTCPYFKPKTSKWKLLWGKS